MYFFEFDLSIKDILYMNSMYYSDDDYDLDDFKISSNDTCYCGGTYIVFDSTVKCNQCSDIMDMRPEEYIENLESHVDMKKIELTLEQRKSIRKEIELLNKDAKQKLQDNIIDTAVDIFAELRGLVGETRNKKRQQYLACCIYKACTYHDSACTRRAIQVFCNLDGRNISAQLNVIQIFLNAGKLDPLKYKNDTKKSFVNGTFNKLKIDSEELKEKVYQDVVYISDIVENKLQISSNSDSRIVGAIYIAMRLNKHKINLQKICDLSSINSETIQSIINKVKENKNLFPLFEKRFNP